MQNIYCSIFMTTESDKLIIGENSLIVNSPFANESCPKFIS